MSNDNIAFVFPGQGSQKVGLLAAAHQQFDAVRETFVEASDVLGYDMWDLIQNGDQDALNMTTTTQPVLLSASVALWRAWESQGGAKPTVMSGHSLGEFSALVCAGSIEFRDGVELVEQRGEFMQEAIPVGVGAMAAIIGLDDGQDDARARALSPFQTLDFHPRHHLAFWVPSWPSSLPFAKIHSSSWPSPWLIMLSSFLPG